MPRGMSGRIKGLIEADVGLIEEARASAEDGLRASEALHDQYFAIACAGVLGRLELASGNIEAAGAHLRELPARLVVLGINDPGAPVWQDAVEVLVALGELEPARVHLEHYEVQAERMRSPWAIAAAARCRGLLAGAEGDTAGASAAFERALAQLDEHPSPLERARTLLCFGSALRRAQQKTAAREALHEAVAILDELGARLWGDRAGSELAGQRPASTLRGAHGDRAPSRDPRGAGSAQQGDRVDPAPRCEHRRGAPVPRLPQARCGPGRSGEASGRSGSGADHSEGRADPNLGLSWYRAADHFPHDRA